MSSFLRNIQRKFRPNRSNAKQRIEPLASGGYRVLHPTRGWRVVSAPRAKLYGYVQ